jgi:hypothetical protein
MKLNVRLETVHSMLDLCKKHKEGKLLESELLELLDHDDYKVEFERYNMDGLPLSKITKKEFVDYFMNLFDLEEKDIKNERLKMRYPDFIFFFNNLDYYREKIKKLIDLDKNIFNDGLQYTYNGLPQDAKFDKLNFLFTISIGNSFGWPYNDCVHFDVINLFKFMDIDNLEVFKAFIGHEVHHIGLGRYLDKIYTRGIDLEGYFYTFFSFEGLAVKYCNNSEGFLTRRIYNNLGTNIGLDKFTWNYFRDEFEEMYEKFKLHLGLIRSGQIDNMDKLNEILGEYWLSPYTKEQDKTEQPKLKHYRSYYLGTEVWGLIHDFYGKEKVFEILNNPAEFPDALNGALKEIHREDLCI